MQGGIMPVRGVFLGFAVLVGWSCQTPSLIAQPKPVVDWAAQLRPAVNPDLADLPDNTWRLLKPRGDVFSHPKTEVGLVYDEKTGCVVYFGGCSSGYTH